VRLISAGEAAAGRPRTPVIALTANAMAHQIAEYMAAGMDGVVAKPIEVRKLFEAIDCVVQSSGEEAAQSVRPA
jgi:CheY-like chemotaxis protein